MKTNKRILKMVFAGILAVILFSQGFIIPEARAAMAEGIPETEASASFSFSKAGGWFETIYAELTGVSASDVTAVSWSGTDSGSLTETDIQYLVRDYTDHVRIDIPGIKAGTYTLSVTAAGSTITRSDISVSSYDRSGYAHFKYTDGVGAYKDDGTLKSGAIVLYVTDDNKNTVSLSYGGKTVTGIGNILNSRESIIQKLANGGVPLVVRFTGCVSDSGAYERNTIEANKTGLINGLSSYGGGDNGHMATLQYGKDVTLEGIGHDAVIDGWGVSYYRGRSFEVRNITFINTPEDAVGMEGYQNSATPPELSNPVERCWIHNNEFYCPDISDPAESDKAQGDGSVDFKRGQYFTCSYNYFEGCHKTNLVGAGDSNLQYNLTFHHNHWYRCDQRSPMARRANIHVYNNVYDMQTFYCQNARACSLFFSEYNLFYACLNPQFTDSNGVIKSYMDNVSSSVLNQTTGNVHTVTSRSEKVDNSCEYIYGNVDYSSFDTDSTLSYIPGRSYSLQTDFTELRKVVSANTGVQKRDPVKPKDVSGDDYSIIKKSGTAVNEITELPYTTAPGSLKKSAWAFSVKKPVKVQVAYGDNKGVLVNEAGENLLEGDGTSAELPAGTYMLQPLNFNGGIYDGTSDSFVTWKDLDITTLSITETELPPDPEITIYSGETVLNGESIEMTEKDTLDLTAIKTPSEEGDEFRWVSSSTAAATLSSDPSKSHQAVLTAVGAGESEIQVTCGKASASFKVNVKAGEEPVIETFSVHFDPGTGTLPEGLSDTTGKEGDVISLSPCTPPEGYTFKGWTIDGTNLLGESYTIVSSDAVEGVITIKALYDEVKPEPGPTPEPDDPYLPDMPSEAELEVTMLPGEVRRLSISTTGQYFYGVSWTVTFPDAASKGCVSVKNGVVTAKKLKKNLNKGLAKVRAEYGGFNCTFTVNVDGTPHDNTPITDGKKKYKLGAPKSAKLTMYDSANKTVKLSVPAALQSTALSFRVLTPGVCEVSRVSADSEKAKPVYGLKPLDAGATWIEWTAELDGKTAIAYTLVTVKKPVNEITLSSNTLTLNTGEGARLIVTGTKGNTDPKDLSFSVKGKGVKVSKSGFVTATAPDSAADVTVKSGKIIKTVRVTVPKYTGKGDPLTLGKPSVNVKRSKSGSKTVALKIGTPKKKTDQPAVTWSIQEEVHTGITIDSSTGIVTVQSTALPGCYTVTATPAADSGFTPASSELIVK